MAVDLGAVAVLQALLAECWEEIRAAASAPEVCLHGGYGHTGATKSSLFAQAAMCCVLRSVHMAGEGVCV